MFNFYLKWIVKEIVLSIVLYAVLRSEDSLDVVFVPKFLKDDWYFACINVSRNLGKEVNFAFFFFFFFFFSMCNEELTKPHGVLYFLLPCDAAYEVP